jgi:hypothetical protein
VTSDSRMAVLLVEFDVEGHVAVRPALVLELYSVSPL